VTSLLVQTETCLNYSLSQYFLVGIALNPDTGTVERVKPPKRIVTKSICVSHINRPPFVKPSALIVLCVRCGETSFYFGRDDGSSVRSWVQPVHFTEIIGDSVFAYEQV
jgi:hypothetical protein